jgi:hypothetical protein
LRSVAYFDHSGKRLDRLLDQAGELQGLARELIEVFGGLAEQVREASAWSRLEDEDDDGGDEEEDEAEPGPEAESGPEPEAESGPEGEDGGRQAESWPGGQGEGAEIG